MKVKITENKSFVYEKINSRELSLVLNNVKPTEQIDHNPDFLSDDITALKFPKDITIAIGDVVTLDKQEYVINKFLRGPDGSYILQECPMNKSLKYLLPLVFGEGARATNYLFWHCLYNSYLYWDKYPQYSNNKYLFLCYRFYNNDTYKEMEAAIVKSKSFIDSVELNKHFTVFIMEIPYKYHYIVDMFNKGKYQYFDGSVKNAIINFFTPGINGSKYTALHSNLMNILSRDKKAVKNLEGLLGVSIPEHLSIDSAPTIDQETLKIK